MIGGILPPACGKDLQNPEGAGGEENAAYERAQHQQCSGGVIDVDVNNAGVDSTSKQQQSLRQSGTVAIV